MKQRHVHPEDFRYAAFEFGSLSAHQAFELHLHLLSQCPECTRRVLEYFGFDSLEDLARVDSPATVLDAISQRRQGEAEVAWLESLPPAERLARAESETALHRLEVIEALLARTRELWVSAPDEARGWAEVALAAAQHIAPGGMGWFDCAETTARAWAYLGNVLRILSDLRGAEDAFRQADVLLARGIFDELVEAEVAALKASLLRALRRVPEALNSAQLAVRLYGDCDCWHLQGKQLLNCAHIRSQAGDLENALKDLERAVPLLNPREEPRLTYVAVETELYLLCELGRFEEARSRTAAVWDLARAHGSSTDHLRVRWCEGRIARALGPAGEAERAFHEVREGFIREGIGYDAALASLDLALVYAEQGRTREVRELAVQMLPLFDCRDLPAGTLAALRLFCQAVRQEEISSQRIAEARRDVRRARYDAPPPRRHRP